ncbi:hypothetical protein SLS62_002680 [Diatrype stigma]|uniref:DUF427 domain-containing protein n=1 Tax=Diatrype stigma TaxID=117547 RepID=A0AAN9UYD0_9PEZI
MSKPGEKNPNLIELGHRLLKDGPVKALGTRRRVRILYNGAWVADTTSAVYVWEHPYYPYYYVPRRDFIEGCLVATLSPPSSSSRVNRASHERGFEILELEVGDRSTNRVLAFLGQEEPREGWEGDEKWVATEGKGGIGLLRDAVRVEFGAADGWFEEDTPIAVHPKDPFRRVDVVHSMRPVRVLVEGVEVARSASSYHLYETGLPRRFYLPPTSVVDWALLQPSSTRTQCPYKGEAEYYDVVIKKKKSEEKGEGRGETREEEVVYDRDLVWYYRTPITACAMIAGCLCFYNEKVDIELDGKLLARPRTHFV